MQFRHSERSEESPIEQSNFNSKRCSTGRRLGDPYLRSPIAFKLHGGIYDGLSKQEK